MKTNRKMQKIKGFSFVSIIYPFNFPHRFDNTEGLFGKILSLPKSNLTKQRPLFNNTLCGEHSCSIHNRTITIIPKYFPKYIQPTIIETSILQC